MNGFLTVTLALAFVVGIPLALAGYVLLDTNRKLKKLAEGKENE